jgi:hypothetical protein
MVEYGIDGEQAPRIGLRRLLVMGVAQGLKHYLQN